MAVAGTARILIALAAVTTPVVAVNEKVANRATIAATAAATAEERQRLAVEAQLADFIEKAHNLRGRSSAAQIRALAKELETTECRYDDAIFDAKGTEAAIQHFSKCVKQVLGLAKKTLDSAAERGERNQRYGDAAKASLEQINSAVANINKLHRSIVTEHKVASDHLAQQVVMIQDQVATLEKDNEEHKQNKGWETKADVAKREAADTDADGFIPDFVPGKKVAPSLEARRFASMAQVSQEQATVNKEAELAQLKEELAAVGSKIAALEKAK